MSISTSEAYRSLEYRHGPKVNADHKMPLTLSTRADRDLGLSLAYDMNAPGMTPLAVGPGGERREGGADIAVPVAVRSAKVSAA